MAGKLPPTPVGVPPGHSFWNDWYEKLRTLINDTTTNFTSLDFSGSNITSIVTRRHRDLQDLQGGTTGEYYHLTAAQYSALPTSYAAPANPTASVGLTAVNGTATTYLRSDAAPALSQAITPTWTGVHSFTNTVKQTGIQEMMRGVNNNAFICGYNSAETIRTGYLQFISGTRVILAADSAIPVDIIINGTTIGTFNSNGLTLNSNVLLRTSTALTNGAGAGAGTITNAPAAGNPTKWIPIVDNGTTRYIPAW